MTTAMTESASQHESEISNVQEWTVSEISQALKKTVEDTYSHIRVRGEISRPARPASGHLYFTLKDATNTLSAVCWRGTAQRLKMTPEDGLEVICTGRLTTYGPRSSYQLVVEDMRLAGAGALLQIIEERRRQLAAEGLFDADRKQTLPFLPQRIGVVTSPTGAVIRDILHRLEERCPCEICLCPVRVQGAGAAEEIAAAIAALDQLDGDDRPDVMIVARGGGSVEDLAAFNEDCVVRAVAACKIPLISAVGHETDTTLIDFAADLRAPTPTAAAEYAVPVRRDLLLRCDDFGRRLASGLHRHMEEAKSATHRLAERLGAPEKLLETPSQRLDSLAGRHDQALEIGMERRETRLNFASERLNPLRLGQLSAILGERLNGLTRSLDAALRSQLDGLNQRVRFSGQMLDSLSYKNILARGFALVQGQEGHLISRRDALSGGEDITLRFVDGDIGATVNSLDDKATEDKSEHSGESESHQSSSHQNAPNQDRLL